MIQIDDVVISLDVFREKFLCNLDACKGECCIEGDAGAPVELDEELTKKIVGAGKILDIRLLDHLIISEDTYFSFADEGIIL